VLHKLVFVAPLFAAVLLGATIVHSGGTQISPSTAIVKDTEWLVYNNTDYGFSLKYPETFVIMKEPRDSAQGFPLRLHRVRFQDKQLSLAETAALEPPQFAVEVFKRDDSASLKNWLKSVQWLSSTDSVESFHVEGAREGVRIDKMEQLAPNQFYYVATKQYVFRLTPLGEHGPDMVASFRLKTRK
jgi:hypothetical protein